MGDQSSEKINEESDEAEQEGEVDNINGKKSKNLGSCVKKSNFTRSQTSVLKKWFI